MSPEPWKRIVSRTFASLAMMRSARPHAMISVTLTMSFAPATKAVAISFDFRPATIPITSPIARKRAPISSMNHCFWRIPQTRTPIAEMKIPRTRARRAVHGSTAFRSASALRSRCRSRSKTGLFSGWRLTRAA